MTRTATMGDARGGPAQPLRAWARWALIAVAVAACAVGATSCGRGSAAAPSARPRIVSLSPAITRALVDLGCGDLVVARTPFCTAVDASVPVAGTSLDVDAEMLVTVQPTHVFLQLPAQGIDPALMALADEHGWDLRAWRLDRLADVVALARALPVAVGGPEGDERQAASVALCQSLEALAPALDDLTPPDRPSRRVLLLVSASPMTAAGRATFLDDLLHRLNATNAIAGDGYVTLSHEDLVRLAPDLIILLRDDANANEWDLRSQVLPGTALDDHFGGKFHLIAAPDALLPSTSLIEIQREMGTIIERGEIRW